jgi:hypothetical protein
MLSTLIHVPVWLQVLITRLESALERISAAETALAEKNREIKALREGGGRSLSSTGTAARSTDGQRGQGGVVGAGDGGAQATVRSL